jgi:hypothetical protein
MEDNKVLDSLKEDPFVVDELFEDIFNGLSGVYLRLYYKESKRGSDHGQVKQAEFLKRFNEIGRLKSSYGLKDWKNKRIAIDEYAPELRKMLDLELRDMQISGDETGKL